MSGGNILVISMFAQGEGFLYEFLTSTMTSYPPNRPTKIPRQVNANQWSHHPRPEREKPWAMWTVIGILVVAGLTLIVWRLQVQKKMEATEKQVVELLATADQLVEANREDEAEAAMRKALEMQPGDVRCQTMIERIEKKRGMIYRKKSAASDMTLASAEQIALTDIKGALEILQTIRKDSSFTPEAQRAAAQRIKELEGGICTLHLPEDWPADAVLLIDDFEKTPKKGIVSDIVHGKRTIKVTRYGFRQPAAMELDFRGLEPLQLPAIEWRLRGAKVFITSRPAGAAVWRNGKDTGKITPCEFEDVDDGPIEFLLKHPKYPETPVKGVVKDRQPIKLTANLQP